ncbi:6151_t:CDS:2 [Ambispora leptoticha]|uniref:6151_t:CDS:1 n=1 Tax=Ambispora leptoticha TaxID=144679 RepID=A0A9N9EWG0_9GLOM|nr:6151_t:CDS:2 [Ambispora leptoticha]
MTSWQTIRNTNKISVEALRAQLSSLGLDPRGRKRVLAERLRHYMNPVNEFSTTTNNNANGNKNLTQLLNEKHIPKDNKNSNETFAQTSPSLSSSPPDPIHSDREVENEKPVEFFTSSKSNPKPQPFEHYLCFDVEATCEEGGTFDYFHEIIEFPVLLIDSKNFEVVDVFHSYVKPSVNPTLTEFCKKLTGIPQSTIDASPSFPEMLNDFQQFLHRYQLFYGSSCAFITDGPWDIRDFIRKQCNISQIPRPSYFTLPWVDIRKLFAETYNCERCNIEAMLAYYGLQFEGHLHSGIDDTRNMTVIAKRLWQDGVVFMPNSELSKNGHKKNPKSAKRPK